MLQFRLSEPEASFVLDCSGAQPKVSSGAAASPAAVFRLSDATLVALASGRAQARDLFQRGALRVDGEVRLARELGVLDQLI